MPHMLKGDLMFSLAAIPYMLNSLTGKESVIEALHEHSAREMMDYLHIKVATPSGIATFREAVITFPNARLIAQILLVSE